MESKKKNTVKRRIFWSNTWMVCVTLLLFFLINFGVVKLYGEYMEREVRAAVENWMDSDRIEELIADWTIRKNVFFLLFALDGILCITVLLLVSQLFTKNLTAYLMQPLDALADGARRIRDQDLAMDITYTGSAEFETVCDAFNEMQHHLLAEQEKNENYEKARTDMIAGISHDLRTPLTAVQGMIKGILDGVASTPEQQQRFLQASYQRCGDMAVLLNQLFYFSSLQTGNMKFSMQPLDVASYIKHYVRAKQELLKEGEEVLTADTDGITEKILVDPELLFRILDNLLENSRKYAETTPLEINITLTKAEDQLQICFADHGVGVPEEKLPFLFDEFYRGDESRNEKKGNGLGLYIVKYLTEGMGGYVYAKSENGFAVFLTFPVISEEEEHARQTENSDCGR